MDLRRIDCFLAVAEHLSFSRAAEKLFLSQSVVSQHVMALEADLKVQLFVRSKRSVALTPAGVYFQREIQRLRTTYDEVVVKTREVAAGGEEVLVIGYDGPMAERRLGALLRPFHKRFPEVTVRLHKESVAFLTDLLLDGLADMIVTHNIEVEGQPNVEFRPIAHSQPCVFLPPGHPLGKQDSVTAEDLRKETLIVDCASESARALTKSSKTLAHAGIDFSDARYVTNGEAIFSMVEAGLGVFIASNLCAEYAEQYHLERVGLDIDVEDVVLGLAWRGDNPNPAIPQFLRCAASVIGQTVENPKRTPPAT